MDVNCTTGPPAGLWRSSPRSPVVPHHRFRRRRAERPPGVRRARGPPTDGGVDGTFVDDRGVVPPGARTAVVAARANGHEVFSCTGRSMAELWDEIVAPGFDVVIASAGGYVEYEGEVLLHRSVPVADVHRVVGFSDRPGVDHNLEANSGLFGSRHARERLRDLMFGGVTDEDVLAESPRAADPPDGPPMWCPTQAGATEDLVLHGSLRRTAAGERWLRPSGSPRRPPAPNEVTRPQPHHRVRAGVVSAVDAGDQSSERTSIARRPRLLATWVRMCCSAAPGSPSSTAVIIAWCSACTLARSSGESSRASRAARR